MKKINNKKYVKKGFTLIEVMVALLVLSFSMMAIIETFATVTRNTYTLKHHHIAYWVGSNYLIEQRLKGVKKRSALIKSTTKMANQKWFITSQDSDGLIKEITQISVKVFDKIADKYPVSTINGYKY